MTTRRVSRKLREHYTRKIKGGDVVTTTSNLNPTQDINQFNNAFNQLISSTTSIPSTESVINPTEDINQINNVFNQLTASTTTGASSEPLIQNFVSPLVSIPGGPPIIWLDPSNTNNLTLTTIMDKSGKGNNAVLHNVTVTSVNNINALELSPSSYIQGALAIPLTEVRNLTSFVVCKILNDSTAHGIILSFNDGISAADYNNTTSLSALTLSGTPDGFGTYYANANDVYSPIAIHSEGESLYNLLYNKFSISSNSITNGKDGEIFKEDFEQSPLATPLNIASYSIGIQGLLTENAESTDHINGVICEVLVFDYDMSDADRHIVEAYLMYKWGLKDNLASANPYVGSLQNVFPKITPDKSDIANETGVLYWSCYWANQYIKIHNGALMLAKSNPTNVEGYTTFVAPSPGVTIPLIENVYAWVKVWHTNLARLSQKNDAPPNITTQVENSNTIKNFIETKLNVAKNAQTAGNWAAESQAAVDIGKMIDSYIIVSSYTPQEWLSDLEISHGTDVLGKAFAALDGINGKKMAVEQGKELMATIKGLLVWNP